jgi:hypothetical protein
MNDRMKQRLCIAINKEGTFDGFLKGNNREVIKLKAQEEGVRLKGNFFKVI